MQYRLVRTAVALLCVMAGAVAASAQITTGVKAGQQVLLLQAGQGRDLLASMGIYVFNRDALVDVGNNVSVAVRPEKISISKKAPAKE